MTEGPDHLAEVRTYAERVLAASEIVHEPFEHLVVDGILPVPYFRVLTACLPDPATIEITEGFGHVKLEAGDPSFARMDAHRRDFWRRFETEIKTPLCRRLAERFAPYIRRKIAALFSEDAVPTVELTPGDYVIQRGIIQCRTAGVRQPPHIDKATNAFTCLFYFSDDPALRPYGTTLFTAGRRDEMVQAYREVADVRAWYPEPGRFDISAVKTLEFRGNRLVAFVTYPYALHGVASDADAARFSMQNYCELPEALALSLFRGWRDQFSEDGLYHGGP